MSDPDVGNDSADTTLSFGSCSALEKLTKIIRDLEIENRSLRKQLEEIRHGEA